MKLFGKVDLVDRIEVPTQRQITDAGQMIVPCSFARTGALQYSAGSLGLKGKDPQEIVHVMRDESEVFCEDSMASFRSAPVTIGHPKDEAGQPMNVTAENAKDLQVGALEGMPVRDEDYLGGTLVITRQDAIDLIEEGTVELSAGYTCDLYLNDEGEIFQKNIRANHIAIVEKGRAGSSCKIADEADVGPDTKAEDEDNAEGGDQAKPETPAAEEGDRQLTDEAEKLKSEVTTLTDERDAAIAKVDALEAERDAAKAEVTKLQDALDASVEERVSAILVAKELTDEQDFSGKSIHEIKLAVVTDQMPNVNLEGKSEAYVEAMFDIVVDSANAETPMGNLLRKQAVEDAKPSASVDKVAEARQKMIARQASK